MNALFIGGTGTISYMLEHPERQVEDQAFDAWCDRIVAAMEQARLSLID